MRAVKIPFVVPFAVGAVLVTLAVALCRRDLESARERWRLIAAGEAHVVAEQVTAVFSDLYEGMRTIARLPAVRDLDRYGSNLDDNARWTIQEIYNNLATNVALSEVYLVPASLDPDAIDPLTGKLQEPTLTFDEMIVGRHADQAEPAADGADAAHDEEEIEEVEIHEYRLMRDQLARFRVLCPTDEAIEDLRYPALTGPEVVTCDNRFFSPRAPDDRDRAGLVYSVPTFAPDGSLRGCVSGVVLTRALRQLLPGGRFALRHRDHAYLVGSLEPGVWQQQLDWIRDGLPGPELVYSEVLELPIVDEQSGWLLWAGRPNAEFEASGEAVQVYTTFAVLLIVSIGLSVGLGLRERSSRRVRVAEQQRTLELQRARDAAETFSRARSNLVAIASAEIRKPLDGVLSMTDLLLRSQLQPEQRTVVEGARQSTRTLIDLLQGILDYTEIDAGGARVDKVEFDLHKLLEDIAHLMAPAIASKPIEFTLMLGDELPRRAIADAVRLRQILVSLVGNAMKFTSQGAIGIRADCFLTAVEPLLCLRVSDTGIGIDAELRARLFEPFTQGEGVAHDHGGTGLGLATSRGLAVAMGGSLDLLPTPGAGSTFVVTIPLALPTRRGNPETPLAGRTVLLVQERLRLRAMLAADLTALGATVAMVPGIVRAQQMLDAGRSFEMIILDCASDPALAPWLAARPADDEQAIVLAETWDQPIAARDSLPACVREVLRLPLGRLALGAAVLRALRPGNRPGAVPVTAPASLRPANATTVQVAAASPSTAAPGPVGTRTADAAAASASAGPSPALPPATPSRSPVLVCSEQDAARLVVCAGLRRLGVAVEEFTSALAAAEFARRQPIAGLVVDWEARGAETLVQHLRGREPNASSSSPPIVVFGKDADRAAATAAGANAVLLRSAPARELATALGLAPAVASLRG